MDENAMSRALRSTVITTAYTLLQPDPPHLKGTIAPPKCFSCSVNEPNSGSCRLNAGHPTDSKLLPSVVYPIVMNTQWF